MAITIERSAQRIYLVGNTYPIKDRIKAIGGHWDGDRKAWWVGAAKVSEAEALASGTVESSAPKAERKISDDSKVVAKATYKGRTYYVLWMGRCASDAEKAHLTVLDGSIDFWADLAACEITKRYEPRQQWDGRRNSGRTVEVHQTIGGIRKFIERQREGERAGNICAECGKAGELVRDLEDGQMKHRHCCDIEP